MPIEIEAKMKVPELQPVRARLQDSGANPVAICIETNTFFDTEDRSLLAADQGLRLRKTSDTKSEQVTFKLTFKGPRKHGPLKNREEVELSIANDRDAMQLLTCLGFQRVLSFEKKRETWTLGNCLIELDELPHLGTFVEIEGPDDGTILRLRDQLGLHDRPLVKASYIALLMSHLQEHGRADRTITFADVQC